MPGLADDKFNIETIPDIDIRKRNRQVAAVALRARQRGCK
jgi:hypothetical protein